MLQKLFVAATALFLSVSCLAQTAPATASEAAAAGGETEKKTPFTFSGYIDAYFRYNFANAKKDKIYNNFTSFTNSQNSFELGMASVKVEHSAGKVGAVVDLGFGKRAEEFSYNDENTRFIVKQAYLTYTPSEKIKLTAGSWATHVGYEMVDPHLNRNYSMSYMFSYGPFFHTGVKGEISFGKSTLMLGIANPTDLKSADFQQKMIIAQYAVATKNDKVKLYVNYQGGKASDAVKLNQEDIVLTASISDKFSIGYNGSMATARVKDSTGKYGDAASWWGSALYANIDPKPWLGLTLRGEYFDDKKSVSAGAFGANIFATTLSANIKIDNLTVIPELRLENASSPIFAKGNGAATKQAASVLLAAVYRF
jgi:Putative beta-barrel porin-2, OmpL-like. bbp2